MEFPSAVEKCVLLSWNQTPSLSISSEKLLKTRVGRRVREIYYTAGKSLTLDVDSSTNQVMTIILHSILLLRKEGVYE